MKRLMMNLALIPIYAVFLGAAVEAQAQFTISGTVTDPQAAPVASVEIRLFTDTGVPIGIPPTFTGITGDYSIAGLPSGNYVLQFRPPTATKLVPAELSATVAGANATRNATLQLGHLLFGYVRDGAGVGIPSIDLQVWDRDSGDQILTPGDDSDATGFYDVVVPTGEYDLEWRAVAPGSPPYIPSFDRAQIEADTHIDVTMLLGMLVSGRITDSMGNPVPSVNLDFIDTVTGIKADTPGDNTFPDGTFTAHVPLGTYGVIAKPMAATRLLAGFLPDIVVMGDISGVDFVLEPGHLMSGTATSPGGPVEGVDVDVTDTVTGVDVLIPFDVTNAVGQYQIVVPAGQFHVGFSPPTDILLAPQIVPDVVVAGDVFVNVALQAGVVFSGTVTTGGLPVPGTDIDLKDPVTGLNVPLAGDGTDIDGNFSTVAAPGTYILEIEPPKAAGLVAFRDLNFNLAGTTHLPIALSPGARVTGTVTTNQGIPLPDVNFDALRTADSAEVFTPGDHTNSQGQYEVIIPADSYTFKFKLGVQYAIPDSVMLPGVVIVGDTVVDAVFLGPISAVGENTPSAGTPKLTAMPNPFNPTTTISFELVTTGQVRMSVHGLDGAAVAVLTDQEYSAGEHSVVWNGRDNSGRPLSSGVYLVALNHSGVVRTMKVALVK